MSAMELDEAALEEATEALFGRAKRLGAGRYPRPMDDLRPYARDAVSAYLAACARKRRAAGSDGDSPMHFRLVAGYENRPARADELAREFGDGRRLSPMVREPKWFVFTAVKPVPPMELDFTVEPVEAAS